MDFLKKLFGATGAADDCNKEKIINSLPEQQQEFLYPEEIKTTESEGPGNYRTFTPIKSGCMLLEPGFYLNNFQSHDFVGSESVLRGLDRPLAKYDSVLYADPNKPTIVENRSNPIDCSHRITIGNTRDPKACGSDSLNTRFESPSGCGNYSGSRLNFGANTREIAKQNCKKYNSSNTI